MEIRNIATTAEFDALTEDWRTLNVWTFGPLGKLEEENTRAVVKVAMVNNTAVAYLIADDKALWHIETNPEYRGNGYARQLAQSANVTMAWEVCTDEGAAFCESLGIEYEDCRD